MGQGYSISTYYRLTDGRLEKMENFVHETAGDPNVPPYVINDEEVSEEDFNSRKEKWNQISSHFVTISYDGYHGYEYRDSAECGLSNFLKKESKKDLKPLEDMHTIE